MKILFLNTLYTPNLVGGAERVVQSLAEGVVKAGHQAVVVSSAPQKSTSVDLVEGVKVYYVGMKNLYWPFGYEENPKALKPLWHALDSYNPWMAREVARILDVERPDLVHTNILVGFSALSWKAIKQRSLPLVHTMHDYYLLCPRSVMFRNGANCEKQCRDCRLYTFSRGRLSRHVDAVVGVSEFTLERHLEFGYFAETPDRKVIYNAYEGQGDTPPPGTRSLPIRFGYLGQLVAIKGIETLLEAVRRLPEGSCDVKVAGRGPEAYERHLRAGYEAPSVQFVGHVRPEDFFREIDVLVVPSVWYEPSTRVISEAYAYGVPVIGSRRGGIPELVEEGSTGFLFDPDRPEDLVLKLRKFIADPGIIDGMRSACLKRSKRLLPENINAQYLEVYADAMERR